MVTKDKALQTRGLEADARERLRERISRLLEDIKFAPAEGGSEMDEGRSRYGQFFVEHCAELLASLTAHEEAHGWQFTREEYERKATEMQGVHSPGAARLRLAAMLRDAARHAPSPTATAAREDR